MSPDSVIQVTEQTFESEVLERSRERPVLVDFWAAWCAPCQVLGPVLEKLARESEGAFVLAKVDTDANPRLAALFEIRSIPAAFLFVDGRPVDRFTGALPEERIREFLRPHLSAPTADLVAEAEACLARGDEDGARERLERALTEQPDDARAHLVLARIAFRAGDDDAVTRHIEAIPEDAAEARAAAALRDAARFRDACGDGEDAWRTKLAESPDDLDARYALGCCLAASARYEEALAELLEVVKRDRRHADGAARKAMVTIFGLLEPGSDVVREYRRQLAIYL